MPAKKTIIKRHKRRHTRNGTKKAMHKAIMLGGAATYDSDSLAAKYASCGSADRHNLQTDETNLDLINGGGVVPAGQTGGADVINGSCPGNAKLLSFKDYTNNVASLLGVTQSVPEPSMQMGGGYSIDPAAEQIGGQPGRVGYSDCCPPVSLEGNLIGGVNTGAVCGQQAGGSSCGSNLKQAGGSSCGSNPKQAGGSSCGSNLKQAGGSSCGSNLKQAGGSSCGASAPKQAGGSSCGASAPKQAGGSSCGSNPKQAGGSSCGSNLKQAGGKKHRKSKGTKRTQKKTKKQHGGDSVPAAFPAESHTGVDGDFSDHGPQLHYDARQPFWDTTAR